MFFKLTVYVRFKVLGGFWSLHHLCYSQFAVIHMGNKKLSKASHKGATFGREDGEKKNVLQINPANELVRGLHSVMTKDPG